MDEEATKDEFLSSLASIRASIAVTAKVQSPPISKPGSMPPPFSPPLTSSSILVRTPARSPNVSTPKEVADSLVLASKLANAERELSTLRSKVVTLRASPKASPKKKQITPKASSSGAGIVTAEYERAKEELRKAKIKIGELTKEGGDLRSSLAILEGKMEGVIAKSNMKCSDLQAKLSNALGELDMKSAMLESSKSVGSDADSMVKKLTERYEEERERMRHSIDSLQKAHALSVKQARASGESRDTLMAKMFSMENEKSELYDRAIKAESAVKELREAKMAKAQDNEEAKTQASEDLAKVVSEKEKALKSAADAKERAAKSDSEAKAAKEAKAKAEVEAKRKIETISKKVVELEGKVKGAAATLQSEVLRVKKQQLLAEKGREEVKEELSESQEELKLATEECMRLKGELEKAKTQAAVEVKKAKEEGGKDLKEKFKKLESEAGEKDEELRLSVAEVKRLKTSNDLLKKDLMGLEGGGGEGKGAVKALKDELDRMNGDMKGLKEEFARSEDEVKELKDELEQAEAEVKRLKETAEKAKGEGSTELVALKEELAKSKQAVEEAAAEAKKTKDEGLVEFESLKGELVALKEKLAESKQAVAEAEKMKGEGSTEVEGLEGELLALKEELAKSNQAVEEAAAEAKKMKDEASAEVESLNAELVKSKQELEKSKKEAAESKPESGSSGNPLLASSSGNPFDSKPTSTPDDDSKKALEALKEEHEELQEELGLAVEEVKRLKSLLEIEKGKSEVSEALLGDTPAAEGNLMKKLAQDNDRLKNALSAMEAESKEISKKIAEEHKTFTTALDTMEGDLAEAREECRCAEEEVRKVRKERDAIRSKLESLNATAGVDEEGSVGEKAEIDSKGGGAESEAKKRLLARKSKGKKRTAQEAVEETPGKSAKRGGGGGSGAGSGRSMRAHKK